MFAIFELLLRRLFAFKHLDIEFLRTNAVQHAAQKREEERQQRTSTPKTRFRKKKLKPTPRKRAGAGVPNPVNTLLQQARKSFRLDPATAREILKK